ncbi:unnamed protein product [Camellia sinensis]
MFLFEMGLELSLARLKALAKFAFGMGLTKVNIRNVDEAIVIGAALSLSSSAFVLQNLVEESIWPMLAKESLKTLRGLGLLSLGGKYLLRRVFEVVAEARSSEAFVALCLLTVAGTSLLT